MLFDKSLMKKSKSVKSACGKKKSVKAAVDGGWEVPDHLAHEAYDLAEEYFGTEDINQQIVDALSDTELAENLAFIFRMNDFREWDDYLEENYPENEDDDDIEESVRAKRKRAVKASKSIKASVESGYTEDLSDFGMREIELLRDILDAWINNGLPDDFEYSGVKPAFNTRSGYVFLVNDEYQVAMEVDGVLESFYTTPYEGYEGFYGDLLDEADNSWNYEDLEYLRDIAENRGDSDGADKLTALMAENSDDDIEESVRAKRKRAVRASKKSVKRFKVNASTGKVSYKRRNRVTASNGNEIVDNLLYLTHNMWFEPMSKFSQTIYNADEIIPLIDFEECVEFGTLNGQELLIYDMHGDRKHIKYSCSMTIMFDEIVLTDVWDENGQIYACDWDAIWDELAEKNNWNGEFDM